MLAPASGLTGGAPVLQLLAEVVAVAPDEPSMRDMPQQELRLQNEMVVADASVTQLLTDPRVRRGRQQQRRPGSCTGGRESCMGAPPLHAQGSSQCTVEAIPWELPDMPTNPVQLPVATNTPRPARFCPLCSCQVMELMGVTSVDSSGDPVFDFGSLQRLLQERYEDYAARSGGQRGGCPPGA